MNAHQYELVRFRNLPGSGYVVVCYIVYESCMAVGVAAAQEAAAQEVAAAAAACRVVVAAITDRVASDVYVAAAVVAFAMVDTASELQTSPSALRSRWTLEF